MADRGTVVSGSAVDAGNGTAGEDLLDDASGPHGDDFVIDDRANLRRVRALAATVPIEDLDRAKSSFSGDFWHLYDLRTLAVAAIDRIALALGLSSGASPAALVKWLTRQAARQRPESDPDEHALVASRVLDRLIGAGEVTRRYVDYSSGTPIEREYGFRLVYEQLSPGGAVHLRVSEEAINVLVDALDMDIDDAQDAQEAWMRRLVERGMLGKASGAARQSLRLSALFLERVQTIVRDTAADITAHDWGGEVAAFLDECLRHVGERLQAERELRDLVTQRRDAITEGRDRAEANALLEILSDCLKRHVQLHTFLMTTRGKFRRAQDAAFAAAPAGGSRYDLSNDLLQPLLHAPVGAVGRWAEDLFMRFIGPSRLIPPSLAVFVDEACEAPPERMLDEPEEAPFFVEPTPPWWEPVWEAAATVIEEVEHPVTLTELLGRAVEVGSAQGFDPLLVAEAVCHRAYELVGSDPEPGLLAVPTDGRLDNDVLVGPDLVIVRLAPAGPSSTTGTLL